MITKRDFLRLIELLGEQASEDIEWAESRTLPANAEEFARETIYVICNSGMKHAVAVLIFQRCMARIKQGLPVKGAVLGKSGKAKAIDEIWSNRAEYFKNYLRANDKVAYCLCIPWIGGITAFHVAKNFGAQVAKPDVHLQRLADLEGVTAQALCERLSAETGYKVPTIDTILWRACAYGFMDSHTGKIKEAA